MGTVRRMLFAVPWLVGGATLYLLLAGTEVFPVLLLYIALSAACVPGALVLGRLRRGDRPAALDLRRDGRLVPRAGPEEPSRALLP